MKNFCKDCSKQDYCSYKYKVNYCDMYKKRKTKKGVLKREMDYF